MKSLRETGGWDLWLVNFCRLLPGEVRVSRHCLHDMRHVFQPHCTTRAINFNVEHQFVRDSLYSQPQKRVPFRIWNFR